MVGWKKYCIYRKELPFKIPLPAPNAPMSGVRKLKVNHKKPWLNIKPLESCLTIAWKNFKRSQTACIPLKVKNLLLTLVLVKTPAEIFPSHFCPLVARQVLLFCRSQIQSSLKLTWILIDQNTRFNKVNDLNKTPHYLNIINWAHRPCKAEGQHNVSLVVFRQAFCRLVLGDGWRGPGAKAARAAVCDPWLVLLETDAKISIALAPGTSVVVGWMAPTTGAPHGYHPQLEVSWCFGKLRAKGEEHKWIYDVILHVQHFSSKSLSRY